MGGITGRTASVVRGVLVVQSDESKNLWRTHRNPKRKRGNAFGHRSRFELRRKRPNCTTARGVRWLTVPETSR